MVLGADASRQRGGGRVPSALHPPRGWLPAGLVSGTFGWWRGGVGLLAPGGQVCSGAVGWAGTAKPPNEHQQRARLAAWRGLCCLSGR